jgi:hypothetical protein
MNLVLVMGRHMDFLYDFVLATGVLGMHYDEIHHMFKHIQCLIPD